MDLTEVLFMRDHLNQDSCVGLKVESLRRPTPSPRTVVLESWSANVTQHCSHTFQVWSRHSWAFGPNEGRVSVAHFDSLVNSPALSAHFSTGDRSQRVFMRGVNLEEQVAPSLTAGKKVGGVS